jgi:hypothetical protein
MNTLKPCSYCGNSTFHYFPDLAFDVHYLSTVLGIPARKNAQGWWLHTIVACTSCGNTLVFTKNADQLSSLLPGAKVIQAGVG